MTDSPFLQSFVAPICRFTGNHDVTVEELYGTCFLIGSDGIFLTARHVLEKVFTEIKARGGSAGAFPMQVVSDRVVSLAATILDYEFAPEPFDIAVFTTAYRSNTPFRLVQRTVEVWQDVAAMGYPASNVHKSAERLEIQQRAHKGYIQRCIPAGRLHPGNHPNCFELNFSITNGLSGSPLFIYRGATDEVIGVCTHSHESRIVLHSHMDVIEENAEFHEVISRVEEFGIAQDLRPLIDWAPGCLNGRTIGQVMQQV
ncbi:trypsin-like peptidase domain-containing protein [Bradyrhizobium sp. 190]|uniref:S1 family peptidase n=1 Tax=Bradyrhizobium sp. 190 TaxID=2782658 RepID=UPI001FF94823|nr:serine protease [Bradyrhizobium sp. 190]MCK1517405.1 trypsin-like peptidase domain-containing protein [Bradyrhizobium sp. 190]